MALLDHEGGADFPYFKDDVFDALVAAIPQISGMKIDTHDKVPGRILAKAGVTLWSWGEIIPITLIEVAQGRTRVNVTSTPKTGVMFGGAFDLGKNRKNIENILSAASKILSVKSPVKQMAVQNTAIGKTVADRLGELKQLLEQGLINESEFEQRKSEIMSEL
jgi:hypothetical protein